MKNNKIIYYIPLLFLFYSYYFSLLFIILFILSTFKIIFCVKPKLPIPINNNKKIFISILIPIFNEEKNLRILLEMLIKNYVNCMEIILINDVSTDNSKNICIEFQKKYEYIKYFERKEKRGWVAGVLNDGLKNINLLSTHIFVLNGDCQIELNLINNLLNYLIKYDSLVVNLSNYSKHNFNFIQNICNFEKRLKNEMFYKVEGYLNNGYVIERKILNEIGGWDETTVTEDLKLSLELKKRSITIFQNKSLFIYDNVPDNLERFVHQKYRWILGDLLNRLQNNPQNIFDIIVNIYFLLPFFLIFSFVFKILFLRILLINILVIFFETILSYKLTKSKLISCLINSFFQFLIKIVVYLLFIKNRGRITW